MKSYIIASEEGAQRYAQGQEVGALVELQIPHDEKRAVIAAGWLEEVEEPSESSASKSDKKKEEK